MQGTAADLIKLAMIDVQRWLYASAPDVQMIMQVHDELVLEVAPGESEALEALVREQMGGAAELTVPLDVSVGTGRSWWSEPYSNDATAGDVFVTYNKLASKGEPLAQHRVEGRAASYYARGEVREITQRNELLNHLVTNDLAGVWFLTGDVHKGIVEKIQFAIQFMAMFTVLTGGLLLNPENVTNLVLQNAHILIMALGMIMIIVAGHIDLSVGSVSGLAAAVMAVLVVYHDQSLWLALLAGALAVGAWAGRGQIAYAQIATTYAAKQKLAVGGTLTINGTEPAAATVRPEFASLQASYPDRKLTLETANVPITLVDLKAGGLSYALDIFERIGVLEAARAGQFTLGLFHIVGIGGIGIELAGEAHQRDAARDPDRVGCEQIDARRSRDPLHPEDAARRRDRSPGESRYRAASRW